MADLFLSWDEAQGENLPHYCVSCAAPATEWADWRICKTQNHIFSIQYTYVDVTLPVCPEHRKPSWVFLRRVIAREIHDDGVVLGHVSPGFVEAVFDFREDQEPQPAFAPARRPNRRNHEAEDYGEPPPRRLPRYARDVRSPSGWTAGKIILLVFIVLLFAPCTLMVLFGVLMGLLRGI
jgi:hypothetical protein